jgi:hypothetical protein
MTEEQINVAIHAALGNPVGCRRCSNPECAYNSGLNYTHDLNAMHEAEIWFVNNLMPQDWESYRNKLLYTRGYYDVHSTARQRAEAFLRTLGKWEEGK